jgi:hypothetical protein
MTDISNKISEHNAKVYMDIANDMFKQGRGLFSFVVKVDGKHIVDYMVLEMINYGKSKD